MSTPDRVLREESVRQYCRALRLPTVGSQCGRMAEEAIKQQYGPVRYLEALLAAEIEERERNAVARRIFEAKLPRMKTLEECDFAQTPQMLRLGFIKSVNQEPARRIWQADCV